jgi:tRNA 2-thiouridine synthesizing protein A
MAHQALDTKGLLCPLPVLRARKALKLLAVGDRLAVEATDNAAAADFTAFCAATGHKLVGSSRVGDVWHLEIEKCSQEPSAGR